MDRGFCKGIQLVGGLGVLELVRVEDGGSIFLKKGSIRH